MKRFMGTTVILCALTASAAQAAITLVDGGRTSVVLDTATLAAAANLNLSSISPDVIVPGDLAGSVAFGINARDVAAPALPTTFSYDASNFLGTFAGSIEHSGSVFFNADAIEVGDFTIGFDAARAGTLGGAASGFFVRSTSGLTGILFDVENPSLLSVAPDALGVGADLLVAPEFAGLLLQLQFASGDLSGADVGDALVQAVPEPSAALAALLGLVTVIRRR